MLKTASFHAMGVSTTVAVEDDRALSDALRAAHAVITSIDDTCSRFKPSSELSRLNEGAARAAVPISALLAEAIDVALDAARLTGGLVDPTVGRLMERIGYSVTFRELPLTGPPISVELHAAAGWRTVTRDCAAQTVSLEDGVALDLGAVGKAWAADRAATAAAQRIGADVLVECGGDVAVAGPGRPNGWPVRVSEGARAATWQDVLIFDGGLATSGPHARMWRRGARRLHHILDPATGHPVDTPWRMVTVAAQSCAHANAAATAAVILGGDAPAWLQARRLPARLVSAHADVITLGDWPA